MTPLPSAHQGSVTYYLRATDASSAEFLKQAWLKDISDTKQVIGKSTTSLALPSAFLRLRLRSQVAVSTVQAAHLIRQTITVVPLKEMLACY